MNEDHDCPSNDPDREMTPCLDAAHRSEEVYRIGGLRDDLDAKQVIMNWLTDLRLTNGQAELAAALLARLAHAEPALLVTRLYEVDTTGRDVRDRIVEAASELNEAWWRHANRDEGDAAFLDYLGEATDLHDTLTALLQEALAAGERGAEPEPATIWVGLADCGCPTTWIIDHPSAIGRNPNFRATVDVADKIPTVWVRVPPGFVVKSHTVSSDGGFTDRLDWSPAACPYPGVETAVPHPLEVWIGNPLDFEPEEPDATA